MVWPAYVRRALTVWDSPESEWIKYAISLPTKPSWSGYLLKRSVARVRADDPPTTDLRIGDGRVIRSQSTGLPDGGRMLTYHDVTDLIRQAEQLAQSATIDAMTGVFNRRHFLELAAAEWSRFKRYRRRLSLLMIDLDDFESINHRFGHDVGEQALIRVAIFCREASRGSDIVARLGGKEFAVLLLETDLVRAKTIGERLRQKVKEKPLVAGDDSVSLTVTIGAAEADLSMSRFDALLKLAHRSIYEAKSSGRDLVAEAVEKPMPDSKIATP